MTNKEAIEVLQNTEFVAPNDMDTSVEEAIEMACAALEEKDKQKKIEGGILV